MNAADFLNALRDVLAYGNADDLDELREQVATVHTFSDAGLLTMNDGLVVRLADGTEVQLQANGHYRS